MISRVDLSRLPRTDEHFVGRLQELAVLDDAWTTGKNVVSVVAWGGVGKTALVPASTPGFSTARAPARTASPRASGSRSGA
jgi:hypothetical protein